VTGRPSPGGRSLPAAVVAAVRVVLDAAAAVITGWPDTSTVRFVLAAAPGVEPVVFVGVHQLDDDGLTIAAAAWSVDIDVPEDLTFWAAFEALDGEVVTPWLVEHGAPPGSDVADGWSVRFPRSTWREPPTPTRP